MGALTVRAAREADAAVIAALCNRLNALHGVAEVRYSEAQILRDAFGPAAILNVLLAEAEGRVVGYASFQDFYNSDLAARGLWLHDLFVDEAVQRLGAGRALMAAVARAALAHGARSVCAKLGVKDEDARILELEGKALQALAAEAAP